MSFQERTVPLGSRTVAIVWSVLAGTQGLAEPLSQATTPFIESRVEVRREGVTLALRDVSGDGRLDLVQVDARGVSVRVMGPEGRYPETPTLRPWTSAIVGWDLADLDGDGATELLLAPDGRHLVRLVWEDGKWGDPENVIETPIYIPAGLSRIPFARDVDGDGRVDLVLPGPGRFLIYLNRRRGTDAASKLSWAKPLAVGYDPDVAYDFGDPKRLSSTFGQSVRVPFFTVEDVDGDGKQDLVTEIEGRVAVHLARPEIDALPTWELDLSSDRRSPSLRDVDLDDLLSSVSGFAQWMIVDMDGVPPNDLAVGANGEIRLYLGGGATGENKKPSQVLKASGNVLRFFLRQVVGDARPDLQVVRGERISLARLLKYLLLPGQLDFDVLTYENKGGMLARRPTQRATIGLRVPRLMTFLGEAEAIGDKLEEDWKIPAARIDWDQDGNDNDIVDERDGELVLIRNAAPPPHKFENLTLERGVEGLVEKVLLEDTDSLGDGGVSVIDLGTIDQFAASPGATLRSAASGRTPDLRAPLWNGKDDRVFRGVDLNADGKTDILTVIESEDTYRIQFLIQR